MVKIEDITPIEIEKKKKSSKIELLVKEFFPDMTIASMLLNTLILENRSGSSYEILSINSEGKIFTLYSKKYFNKTKQLAEKYHAIQELDTLNFEYSIEYQDFFSDTNKHVLINKEVYITDIHKKNDKYFISGVSDYYPVLYFQFECSKQQMNQILKLTKDKYPRNIGLIARLNFVAMLEFAIGTEVAEDEDFSTITIEGSDDFFMKGELVDFYIEEEDE